MRDATRDPLAKPDGAPAPGPASPPVAGTSVTNGPISPPINPTINGAAAAPITPASPAANGPPAAASPAATAPPIPASPAEAADGKRVPAWRAMFAALKYPQYRLLISGLMPALFCMMMGMVSFSYIAYTLSGSATVLGMMGLAWGVPMLLLSLVGGVAADRFPRRRVLMATMTVMGITATINAILVITDLIQVWHLFAVGLIQGTAFAFNMPARTALIGEVVGREDMPNAVALNNAAMNLSRIIGPALAGYLIAWPLVGPGGVFAIMAAGYLFVVLTISRLTAGRTVASTGQTPRSSREQLVDGLTFIRHSPPLRTLLSLAFIPILLGMPYQTLLPVFALSIHNVGPEGMGLMQMASGIGALAGSLLVAAFGTHERKSTIQLVLGVVFGISLVAFALTGSFLLAMITLPIVGVASSGYMALNNALIMSSTPRELYGRVMSVYMMTFAAMPLGSLPAASLSDAIGPQLTVALCGALLTVAVVAIAVLVPSYRKIR